LGYNIVYKSPVKRDLKNLSKAVAKHILDQLEGDLSDNAARFPPLKGDFAGLRQYRVSDYRVIFAIIENDVLILRIGHRMDVYK
jgi:mRNA interferase RelE/StbE